MAQYKKQHFVPQFYLRLFSYEGNNRSIGLYNLPNDQYVPESATIKNQAREKHFYDSDGEVEEVLGEAESYASNVIKSIIADHTLPDPWSLDHFSLVGFLALQSLRTKYSAEASNDVMEGMWKKVLKHDHRIGDEIENYRIRMRNPAQFSIRLTPMMQIIISDLEMKILVNNTSEPFITSDHPVVRYNQLLECRQWPGNSAGFAMRGLQMLLPLNHETYLFLFDPWAYSVGDPQKQVVNIDNPGDVRSLNVLEMVNAYENLYFDHHLNSIHLQKIKEEGFDKRRGETGQVKEFLPSEEGIKDGEKKYVPPGSNEADTSAGQSLIVSQYSDIRIGLELSFIKETYLAQTEELDRNTALYRDRALVEFAESKYEEMKEVPRKERSSN